MKQRISLAVLIALSVFLTLVPISAQEFRGGIGGIVKDNTGAVLPGVTLTVKNAETNVTVLEDQIKHYYGSASATFPVVGAVTVPSPASNYAKQMKQIVTSAEAYLAQAARGYHGKGKPALVFDIDDTLLNTYDYTLAQQFGFDPATNLVYINDAAFPAVSR